MKKSIVLPTIAVTAAVVSGMLLVKPVDAFWPFDGLINNSSTTTPSTTKTPTVIDRIIEKFGLNKDEVETVVTTYRNERQSTRQAQMQAEFEERLTTAVANGKLTQAQKQLVIAKHAELVTTQSADKSDRQAKRAELETWAIQNGIDISYFNQGFGGGRGQGRGMGEGMGMGRGINKLAE